jgi:hypothetical protein
VRCKNIFLNTKIRKTFAYSRKENFADSRIPNEQLAAAFEELICCVSLKYVSRRGHEKEFVCCSKSTWLAVLYIFNNSCIIEM